jgi:hypothetical protein
MLPQTSTNLKNKVNKLHLPKIKSLLPLFEIISNSIHVIQEKAKICDDENTLKTLPEIDKYPVHSFLISL